MRTGAYTIHQSLTAEAAAVLKLSLSLARRRGHAQVTPLHVAFTLLSSSCASPLFGFSGSPTSSYSYGLLKRACLKSHPAHSTAAHPLQCRALELCFNVALNRLPTSTPHSSPTSSATSASSASFSSSLIQPNPTLSNALIAALKRAQANQRRGCIELQQQQSQQQPPPPQSSSQQHSSSQQQQPLLAIKVELDQLIISILDDPSVSRVMREAGFSSTTVKGNLEEESAMLLGLGPHCSSPPTAITSQFFLESNNGSGVFGFWPAQFLTPPGAVLPSCKDDVRAVMDVMVKKQGRRTNPVIVGDSVSMAEAVVGELTRRLERGEVPEELSGVHLLKLPLSYVHLRLMSRVDVDAKVSDLRRSVDTVQRTGLVVYVGDMRWAVDEEHGAGHGPSSFSPVDHMVAELARLLSDLRAAVRGRVWLVATASYQTYMRSQRKKPSLESLWALQAVVVPIAGGTGLALNLHASASPSSTAPTHSRMPKLAQGAFALLEPIAFASRDGEDNLVLCTECSKNYEREASVMKATEAEGGGSNDACFAYFSGWPRPDKHEVTAYKENLTELKRKWSRLCQRVHFQSNQGVRNFTSASSNPWWSACLPGSQSKAHAEPYSACLTDVDSNRSIAGLLSFEMLVEQGKGKGQWSPPPHVSLSSLKEPSCQDVKTTLALGSLLLLDSATSEDRSWKMEELEGRLQDNIPWQSGAVRAVAEAITSQWSNEKKGVWLFMKGSDHVAMRRAALVIAETHSGSADKVIVLDPKKFAGGEDLCSEVMTNASMMGTKKLVLLVEDIRRAPPGVLDSLAAASKNGSLKGHLGQEFDLSDSVIIMTTSNIADSFFSNVISLRLSSEEPSSGDLKRKTETELPRECKRPRNGISNVLDLNLCAKESDVDGDHEEAIPSDITHESSNTGEHGHPYNLLLDSIATHVTLDTNPGDDGRAVGAVRARLVRAFDGELPANEEVVQALAVAAGGYLEEVFEKWVVEVLEPAVKKGGKARVVLGPGSGDNGSVLQYGFMGSVLPSTIYVD